jgi:hypothetical protein
MHCFEPDSPSCNIFIAFKPLHVSCASLLVGSDAQGGGGGPAKMMWVTMHGSYAGMAD